MLDGGPARIPKGTDRRSAYRRESSASSNEEVNEARTAPRPSQPTPTPEPYRSAQTNSGGGSKMPKWLIAVILSVLGVILAVVIGWLVFNSVKNSDTGIDDSKHQAVFLSTGQVYFGRLEVMNDSYMRLTDVFYIQSSNDADDVAEVDPEAATGESPETASAGSMQLIKLGEEVHAPEDEILINRDHVLFYENIRPEGRVSQLIQDYKSGSN